MAETPAGKPVAAPIPVANVVVWVILVIAVLIQTVGVDEAADTVLFGFIVITTLSTAVAPQFPVAIK